MAATPGKKNLKAEPGLRTNLAAQSTSVSVPTTAGGVSLAAANPSRCEITIVNDGANVVYLALNTTDGTSTPTATTTSGIRLNASGGSWTSNAYIGPVAAIAVTGATNVTVAEI